MSKIEAHVIAMEDVLRKLEKATAENLWVCLIVLLRHQIHLNRLLVEGDKDGQ